METVLTPTTRPRWTKLAATGFLLAAAGPILGLIARFIAFGVNGFDVLLPFLILPLVAAAIGAAIVRRAGAWALGVGAFLAFVLAGFSLGFDVRELALPASFFDFEPEVLLMFGSIVALVSCIAAMVSRRRGRAVMPVRGEVVATRVSIILVLVAAATSGIWTIASHSNASSAGAAAISTMTNSKFTLRSYSIAGGATIYVRNDDPIAHTFTVDALDVGVNFGPKDSKVITVPSKPGTYILYCKYHTSHPKNPSKDDMAATLTIT